jgi:tetratricopeptide (TPR) repeat protein
MKMVISLESEIMIDSFLNTPTYSLAIRIAKVYYRKGEYHPSIAWIKKAYSINSKNYQSWYWLAKNLLKLGNKTKAKEVLQTYISNYGANDDIENLLRSVNE